MNETPFTPGICRENRNFRFLSGEALARLGKELGLCLPQELLARYQEVCRTVLLRDPTETELKFLDRVGLLEKAEEPVKNLSGGQKQRVSLAGVMVDQVKILMFDEPLASLDPATGKQAIELIDEIQHKTDTTVLIIEHRLEDVLWRNVDRIILVNEGTILADLRPDELLATHMLAENGIREPLYLTAMRYAGITITPEKRPAHVDTVVLDDADTARPHKWFHALPLPEPGPEPEHLLEVRGLGFGYTKGQSTLHDISFSIGKGEMVSIVGRNGAGKTTSIRIMMDVFPADSGEVLFDGRPIDYDKVGFGYLPEERGLYPKKKIIEQLVYFAELKGMKKSDAVKEIDYWLDRLDMKKYRNKRLDTLSKGNQQKIQLITALAHNPEIVILDEPFSGLDPVNAMLLKDVVKETIQKGKIVLFSSHQMNYIEEFCDNIAIINGGEVVLTGDLHEIKHNYPRNRLVVRSVQDSEIAAEYGEMCSRGESGELIITLKAPDEKKAVMKNITDKYDVDEIKVYEPALNDIFVEYTSDNKQGGE